MQLLFFVLQLACYLSGHIMGLRFGVNNFAQIVNITQLVVNGMLGLEFRAIHQVHVNVYATLFPKAAGAHGATLAVKSNNQPAIKSGCITSTCSWAKICLLFTGIRW